MKLADLPFHIGATTTPHNPEGLPDTWPFACDFDAARGALVQQSSPALLDVLDRAYRTGNLVGTPLADDSFGKPYADDFLAFLHRAAPQARGRALEIGAGVGYITRRLLDAGWTAMGIEPGRGYAEHWKRYGVPVVNDYFPSTQAPGPFDLVCSYAVIEHILDPVEFLANVRSHLAPGGVAVFSVPDCTEEIAAGDPSILLHEHFTYFNAGTLADVLWRAGFDAVVEPSGYGRCLYAVARVRATDAPHAARDDVAVLESYSARTQEFIARARAALARLASEGSLGVYCPSRGLPLLAPGVSMRFFDDDTALQGRYLPPFEAPIEGRPALLATPVDTVVVMSRTFGERIRASLAAHGYGGRVLTIRELS